MWGLNVSDSQRQETVLDDSQPPSPAPMGRTLPTTQVVLSFTNHSPWALFEGMLPALVCVSPFLFPCLNKFLAL